MQCFLWVHCGEWMGGVAAWWWCLWWGVVIVTAFCRRCRCWVVVFAVCFLQCIPRAGDCVPAVCYIWAGDCGPAVCSTGRQLCSTRRRLRACHWLASLGVWEIVITWILIWAHGYGVTSLKMFAGAVHISASVIGSWGNGIRQVHVQSCTRLTCIVCAMCVYCVADLVYVNRDKINAAIQQKLS